MTKAPLARIVRALEAAGQLVDRPATLPEITGVTEDSRGVKQGWLFCAVAGSADDGHRYLPDAVARGAAAAIVSRAVDVRIPQIRVADGRVATAVAAAEWFGRPGDKLRLIGVTGTNGKTTTVALVRHLANAGGDAGSIGTLGAFDGSGHVLAGYGSLTTPGAVELQAVLADLVGRGVRSVVMEASSHALDQRRLETLTLRAGVFTNLTHDHLDYHGDLAAYRAAKLRLSALIAADGVEAVNADDRAWDDMAPRRGVRCVRFGWSDSADVRVLQAELGATGAAMVLRFGDRDVECSVPLIGEFNVSNALAAAAVGWGLGLAPADIAARLAAAPQVPGRMERIVASDTPFLILRDYAHTPDALERAITALRPLTEGRLIVLFGAGGDRDRRKRSVMGGIAARGADVAIVTSDNPRTEDPGAIVREIVRGMDGVPHVAIVDREEAIHHAVALLEANDTLLLAGKGHETYQVVGTEKRPFDERVIVRAALAARSAA
jgi:UDP-N-acetylmuramoyl-L-alanyl-D-glutamate--2,6-diaminopimelate ligase